MKLAYEAGRTGGSLPTVLNAANEKAVALFLDRKIGYLQIPELIEECMRRHRVIETPTVEQILETEAEVYAYIDGKEQIRGIIIKKVVDAWVLYWQFCCLA